MPRPRSLTHADIAAAALAVIDRDGLSALSMRTVASELGMGTMSIYRYVSDRDELEVLVVERVLGDLDTQTSSRSSWRARLSTLVARVRAAAGGHPEVVPLLLKHRHRCHASLRWGEAILGVLNDAGFDVDQRLVAFRTLLAFVSGALQVEHLAGLSGAGTAAIAALPTEDCPLLAETARRAQRLSAEDELRNGLGVVLDGLDELLRKRARPRA